MQNCKTVYEPVVISKNASDNKNLTDSSFFQQLVGSLMFLAVTTRPGNAFPINLLSQACRSSKVKKKLLQQKEHYII